MKFATEAVIQLADVIAKVKVRIRSVIPKRSFAATDHRAGVFTFAVSFMSETIAVALARCSDALNPLQHFYVVIPGTDVCFTWSKTNEIHSDFFVLLIPPLLKCLSCTETTTSEKVKS